MDTKDDLSVSRKRCFTHSKREAVARCPSCARYFCRECVTEHDDRIICASCLRKIIQPKAERQKISLRFLWHFVEGFLGFVVLWLLFYYVGQALIMLPTSFHDGTLWQQR